MIIFFNYLKESTANINEVNPLYLISMLYLGRLKFEIFNVLFVSNRNFRW